MTPIDPISREPAARSAVRERLGEALIQAGLITRPQLREALERQRSAGGSERLGAYLVEMGCVTESDIVRLVAEQVMCPFMTLSPDQVSRDCLDCLPLDFIERHNLLPIFTVDGILTIAVEDFVDVCLIDDISRLSGLEVCVIAATSSNIRETRDAIYSSGATAQGAIHTPGMCALDDIIKGIDADELQVVDNEPEEDPELEATASESPIVKLVAFTIKSAVQAMASDIHIEPERATFRVRYRVDGELVTRIRPPIRLLPGVVSRIKILAGMDISQRRLPQDGGLTITLSDRSVDLRVSTMATKHGEKVVIRIFDRQGGLRSLDLTGMSGKLLERFRAAIREPNGIVLVTGPTGSGKSNTLYGALAEIITDKRNVSTIEDPVERVIPGVNQFQVHPRAGFTFARALRSMLRQDPDVIMVGEIRDTETAQLATEAAVTGHLVLSTLHTNSASTAVPRLVNMGVEPYLVAASLRAVLAQRLVRRLCAQCARPEPLTIEQQRFITEIRGPDHCVARSFVKQGCPACANQGTIGRIGVFDLVMYDESMLTSIVGGALAGGKDQRVHGKGLVEDGMDKVVSGQISFAGLLEIVSFGTASTIGSEAPRPEAA